MRQPITKHSYADYKVNPEQFINILTPEVAYILGILWADGHVSKNNTISISILRSDMDDIINIFLKTGNWRIYNYKPKITKPQTLLCTSNDIIFKFLIKNGYKAKSWKSACKILSKIPEHLKHYWFRGLVDGDGCFHLHTGRRTKQIFIASGYKQDWSFLEKRCKKLKIQYKILRRKQINRRSHKETRNSIFLIAKSFDIQKFSNFIYNNYENDHIGFKRKWNKYQDILKYINEYPSQKKFKYIGIGFDKRTNKYYARTKHNKKQFRLGSFSTIEEAAKCYDERIIEIHGENAKTNKKMFDLV